MATKSCFYARNVERIHKKLLNLCRNFIVMCKTLRCHVIPERQRAYSCWGRAVINNPCSAIYWVFRNALCIPCTFSHKKMSTGGKENPIEYIPKQTGRAALYKTNPPLYTNFLRNIYIGKRKVKTHINQRCNSCTGTLFVCTLCCCNKLHYISALYGVCNVAACRILHFGENVSPQSMSGPTTWGSALPAGACG